MGQKFPKTLTAVIVVLLVIIADQVLKIWVKTHMALYESIDIASWFKLYFVENNGMAFGIEVLSKMFLSIFRIIAVFFLGYYLYLLVKRNYSHGFIACIALVLAGALGNIIDSMFYGEIFTASYPGHVAQMVPFGEGYGSFLHGKVVDMFYFPLIEGTFPNWVPFWGGEEFVFFRPIFNIADSAITVAVILIFIFYRRTLLASLEKKEQKNKA